MTVVYHLSEFDIVNFNLFHAAHSQALTRERRQVRYLPIAIYALVCVLFLALRQSVLLPAAIGAVILAAWILTFPKMYRAVIAKSVARQIREGNTKACVQRTLTLGAEHIETVTEYAKNAVQYTAVERIGIGYGCFFVYIDSAEAIPVPFSAFTGYEQRKEFFRLLKQQCGEDIPVIQHKGDRI